MSFSVGNLGSAKTKCNSRQLSVNVVDLKCGTGTISAITHFGVIQQNSLADSEGRCYTDWTDSSQCLSLSKPESPIYKELLDNCIGKQTCNIDNLQQKINNFTKNDKSGKCVFENDDVVYAQLQCRNSEKDLAEKQGVSTLAGCFGIFAALLVLIVTKDYDSDM